MRRFRKRTRIRLQRTRRGATAVEFAMIAPVFFLVIFVCVEFARISMLRNLANCAAYEAARMTIVEGATREEAIEEAERILARLAAAGAIIEINGEEPIDFTTEQVDVLIEIPMEDNAFLFPLVYEGKVVRAECTLRTERYRGYFDGRR